ncbi:M81 family metallopeptidase [Saliphagus sp. LR7]|uniref:M81 family metallopeptidase n=1 Tax=Saliphagus sp. LR7 TaxID=2282654 RepID=UPI000DF82A02|nr:M81 family metallopeptidase [Saliphagus sp. LR7]
MTPRSRSTGSLNAADRDDIDLDHIVAETAMSSGPVEEETYEFHVGTIFDGIRKILPDVEGVRLSLHGAMVPK